MCSRKVCINASNLHNGGGIQVAASFIDELGRLGADGLTIDVIASSEVHQNLASIAADTRAYNTYEVFDTYGLSALKPEASKKFARYDLVFTVFGPSYALLQHGVQIAGFAQPWIIYPDNEVYRSLPPVQRIKTRLKFFVQALFFRRADRLVVELEHVRNRLAAAGVKAAGDIDVAHNCLSSLYLHPDTWQPLAEAIHKERFAIGFVGRDYPHKNTAVLPGIRKALAQKHAIEADFYVTLSDSEWAAKTGEFREVVKNAGVLSIAQCPSFYRQMDAVVFPSLLECFSATPLEAMAMERPLFASDRAFVRDVCGDFARYFDPLRPESAADSIAAYMRDSAGRDQQRLAAARSHAINFSSARGRAAQYLGIIRQALQMDS